MKQQILHIAPTPFFADRGCHIRIEGIVRCLASLGYENTVCTYHHGRDVAGVETKRISNIKHYTQTAAGPSKYKLWADWKLLWVCFSHYRRTKPAVIHAHLHEGLFIGSILKLMFFWRRTPLVADMQGSLTGELDSHGSFDKLPFLRWPTHMLERALMLAADYIVCSSNHSLTKIRTEFSIDADKISLAQDGADPAQSYSDAEISELRQELGIDSSKILAVYSGALLESKGLQELKALIAAVSESSSDVHFLIVGYPEENLASYLSVNQLEDRCTLTGQVEFEMLPRYLALADIAIEPKSSDAGEGSGKMLNYLAQGLAVVAFATNNNKEFLADEIPLANNAEEFCQILLSLADSHTARQEAAAASLLQFQNHYSWGVTRDQLQLAYQKALD